MASITLTFTAANGKRIRDALTEVQKLDEPATVDDLKKYIITDLKQLVRTSERRAAVKAATDVEEPEIT